MPVGGRPTGTTWADGDEPRRILVWVAVSGSPNRHRGSDSQKSEDSYPGPEPFAGSQSRESVTPARRAAVLRARDSWVSKLIDLSRRNKLLFFRDLKTGTLDLSQSDPKFLSDLLSGESVTLANLLPHAEEVTTSARAKEIRKTAVVNLEERGLKTLFIACGFATWTAADGGRPAESPVIWLLSICRNAGARAAG
jgi:hypothetical protein